ncbi:hypothetical protein ACWD25_18135 [Streptomyces sp. NPDC002920]
MFDHIERYGEVSARHLFTGHLVILVQGLPGLASRFTKRAVRPVTEKVDPAPTRRDSRALTLPNKPKRPAR